MTAMPLPTAGAPPFVGRVIGGKFRVVAPLGEGGMGFVVAAEVLGTGQRVALKLLRPEMLDEKDVVVRFLDEATAASRIQHKNVLRVFESGRTEEGIPYLVMELLDGTSLSSFMRSGARLPAAAIVPILQGVLAGLSAAHAAGVVHRDLKPENVFLERAPQSPGGYEVKLLDFGIAKVMDAAGGLGQRTKTGMILGTPAYMSPEQLRNSKEADARTDLWAAGVMLYEMLCGRHPFPAPTEMARLPLILGAAPAPLDDASKAYAPILERALAKDKAARFASAHEMSVALGQMPQSGVRPTTAPMTSFATPGPRTPAPGEHSYVPAAFTPTALQPAIAADVIQRMSALPESGPGGTLTSPSKPAGGHTLASGPAQYASPPAVVMVPPSQSIEPRTRGLAPGIVIALVGVALVVGFVLGLVVGHSL